MRILLACLMCLILCTSQSFALKGGPPYPGAQVRTTGIYAGVLYPGQSEPNPGSSFNPTNSLGLFSVTIPKTGVGTGTVGIFSNGVFYPGTMQAVADPDTAQVSGVISASFNVTVRVETTEKGTTNLVYNYSANGALNNTKISAPTATFSRSSARLTGTAALTFTNSAADPAGESNGAVTYLVSGFKQAEIGATAF